MGASGWHYVAPWKGSIEATMRALQEKLFDAEMTRLAPEHRPESMEAMWADEEWGEFLGTVGFHSILDIPRVVAPDTRSGTFFGGMRPLTRAEMLQLFDREWPSRRTYDEFVEQGGGLPDEGRWNGACVVLHHKREPVEVAFEGYSGD